MKGKEGKWPVKEGACLRITLQHFPCLLWQPLWSAYTSLQPVPQAWGEVRRSDTWPAVCVSSCAHVFLPLWQFGMLMLHRACSLWALELLKGIQPFASDLWDFNQALLNAPYTQSIGFKKGVCVSLAVYTIHHLCKKWSKRMYGSANRQSHQTEV